MKYISNTVAVNAFHMQLYYMPMYYSSTFYSQVLFYLCGVQNSSET